MPNPIVHEWMRLREAFAVYNPCESVCNQGGRDRREILRARHCAGVIEPVESTMSLSHQDSCQDSCQSVMMTRAAAMIVVMVAGPGETRCRALKCLKC